MSAEMKACCTCGGGCLIMEERKKLNKEEVLRYSDMEIFKGIEKENLNALLYCMKSYVRSYKKGELNLFDLISKKNIQLMEKIEVTSRGSLREKILAYLSLQAQKQKSKYIELSLSRTDMAQFLCTNRSAMTRELASLKDAGIIDFDRNTFILKTQREI